MLEVHSHTQPIPVGFGRRITLQILKRAKQSRVRIEPGFRLLSLPAIARLQGLDLCWDEFERITLSRAIGRAKKAGLLDDDEEQDLISFKDTVRNPYNHYNIRKITSAVVAGKVKLMKLETGEVEEKDVAAKDDPVIQAHAKPFVDQHNVFRVFEFADATVKLLFSRIEHLK